MKPTRVHQKHGVAERATSPSGSAERKEKKFYGDSFDLFHIKKNIYNRSSLGIASESLRQ